MAYNYVKGTPEQRFWPKVDKTSSPTGCWLWMASKVWNGYGHFTWVSKPLDLRYVHHVSWFFAHGEWPPKGLLVLHRCDVRNCVNPDHLFLGTAKDNMVDKVQKGRQGGGARRGQAHRRLLNMEKAREIRRLHADGVPKAEIARRFGIGPSTVRSVVLNITWRENAHRERQAA